MSELENLSKGIIIARPMYTAPEVLDGRPYSFSADIFSLGIMTWEMWYGRRVFSESVYSDVMYDYSCIKVNTCMLKNQRTDSKYMFLPRNVEMKKISINQIFVKELLVHFAGQSSTTIFKYTKKYFFSSSFAR